MILGFTGTREQPTQAQIRWLYSVLESLKVEEAHHGACVGADLEFHRAATHFRLPLVVHPPVKTDFLAVECVAPNQPNTIIKSPKPYLHRDRDIAGAVQGLIALPRQDSEPGPMEGGGTWFTIRYTQRLNKPVMICWPNGTVEKSEIARAAARVEYQ